MTGPNFADRMSSVHKSFIREILKVTQDPTVISFGGGLPNPSSFPILQISEAAEAVLRESGEDALTEQRSVLFKRLHVSRFWDASHRSLVYVVWSDRFINGSPQNSISAVVAEPWGGQAPDLSVMEHAAAAQPMAPQ